jgi:hypothetical protein
MPEGVKLETAIDQILEVLKEAFEGPSEGGSWFLDNDPNAGWFGTMNRITAEDASRPIGGSTIAAHAFHIFFSLEASSAWIRGDRSGRKWDESWRTRSVDDPGWTEIREGIRRRYAELREAVAAHAGDDALAIGAAVGFAAHSAYHLGAIRQKLLHLPKP